MTYQDRQRESVERRDRERQEARSKQRTKLALVAIWVAVLWGFLTHPLLHNSPRSWRLAGVTGLIGVAWTLAYLQRTGELRSSRSNRSVAWRLKRSAMVTTALLAGGVFGFLGGAAAYPIANGLFDGGPVTTTGYDVVSLPPRHCSRSICSVRLRSRDGRNDNVRLRVSRAESHTFRQGAIVELDTKPGRFGEPWIDGYRRVPPERMNPDAPAVSGGHCHPAYERVNGPCPPP